MNKETTTSASRNKAPILKVLKADVSQNARLLEIGSGRGEHALYFSEYLPETQWVTSEVKEKHPELKKNLKDAKLQNVHGPEVLKIGSDDFPKGRFDYVFSANTLHIMSWKECKTFFKLLGRRLREGSLVFFYGPFNYDGSFSSQSNEEFDQWLKKRDQNSGIREFERVNQSMLKAGFKLLKDYEMPANNRFLVFERLAYKGKSSGK